MMENCIVFIWQNHDGLCLVRVRDWKGQQLLCLFVLPVLSPFIQICSIIKNTCSNYTMSLYIMILKVLIKTILCKMKNAWRLFLYELQTLSLLLLCLEYTWIKCWFFYGICFGSLHVCLAAVCVLAWKIILLNLVSLDTCSFIYWDHDFCSFKLVYVKKFY